MSQKTSMVVLVGMLAVVAVELAGKVQRLAPATRHHALIAFAISFPISLALFVAYVTGLGRRSRLAQDTRSATRRTVGHPVFLPAFLVIGVLFAVLESSGPVGVALLAGVGGGLLLAAVASRAAVMLGGVPPPSDSVARPRPRTRLEHDPPDDYF